MKVFSQNPLNPFRTPHYPLSAPNLSIHSTVLKELKGPSDVRDVSSLYTEHRHSAGLLPVNGEAERDRDPEQKQEYQLVVATSKQRDRLGILGQNRDQERQRDREQATDKEQERGFLNSGKVQKKEERDEQQYLARMIGYLTATSSADWSLVVELCDRVSSSKGAVSVATRILGREFKCSEPSAQLSAARLWAIMLRKCSDVFHSQAPGKKFLGIIEDVIISDTTSPMVRERLLNVLAAAAFSHQGQGDEGYHALWRKVKPPYDPDEGLAFDEEDPMLKPSSVLGPNKFRSLNPLHTQSATQPNMSTNEEMREEDTQLVFEEPQSERGSATLLNQASKVVRLEGLSAAVTINSQDIIMKSQDRSACVNASGASAVKPWQPSQDENSKDMAPILTSKEELLTALLGANTELSEAFRIYDELERVGEVDPEEREVLEISRRVTSFGQKSIAANGSFHTEELESNHPARPRSTESARLPFPSPSTSLSDSPPTPSQMPVLPFSQPDTNSRAASPHSGLTSPPAAPKGPRNMRLRSKGFSSKPPALPAVLVPEDSNYGSLGIDIQSITTASLKSVHGSAESQNGRRSSSLVNTVDALGHPHISKQVLIPDHASRSESLRKHTDTFKDSCSDRIFQQMSPALLMHEEAVAGWTTADEDIDSISLGSEESSGDSNIIAIYDSYSAEHDSALKEQDRPPHSPQNGFLATGSLSRGSSLRVQPAVSVDLPGKTVDLTNTDIDSLVSTKAFPRNRRSDFDRVPNLTGRIEIIKGPLFAGGFCDIFSGELRSEIGNEPVAMKMLRIFNTEAHVVKAKKKFRSEVSLWRSLRHNHVLPFYGTCELDEFRLFMISPWAAGGNSLEYLRRNSSANRGRLLWQTASALEYLHSGRDAPQVVHGDLKADNVLISEAGDALLCDFGLSRYVEEIISVSGSSSTGRAGGHARFMAPELLLPYGAPKPTRQSDVFAFGSLMLQIYTEQLPFGDLHEVQAILRIVGGGIPPRPVEPVVLERGCNDWVWTVMSSCWKFEPSDRPDMEEVRRRLAILL